MITYETLRAAAIAAIPRNHDGSFYSESYYQFAASAGPCTVYVKLNRKGQIRSRSTVYADRSNREQLDKILAKLPPYDAKVKTFELPYYY